MFLARIPVFYLVTCTLFIMVATGCGMLIKPEVHYIAVVTPMQKYDSAELAERIERYKLTDRKCQLVTVDTAFIKENISAFIIPILRNVQCVKSIRDLSNNDSSILVLEIREGYDIYQARYDVLDVIKAKQDNLPMHVSDSIVVLAQGYDVKRDGETKK